MRHNTSLYISEKASNRRCGLKLFLFHEVLFGGNKPFTMCKNPLKWGYLSKIMGVCPSLFRSLCFYSLTTICVCAYLLGGIPYFALKHL